MSNHVHSPFACTSGQVMDVAEEVRKANEEIKQCQELVKLFNAREVAATITISRQKGVYKLTFYLRTPRTPPKMEYPKNR
eukprot:6293810-Amphidinium_carterae.1